MPLPDHGRSSRWLAGIENLTKKVEIMGIDGSAIRAKSRKKEENNAKASKNLKTCSTCQKSVSVNAASCPHCGEPQMAGTLTKKQFGGFSLGHILGIAGAIILALGVFAPIISIPIAGSINLFHNGEGDGVALLLFAGLTILFIVLNRLKFLWYTGFASVAVLAYDFYEFKKRMNAATADMAADLAGNPFRGLADMAMASVQIQWGWGVLLLGAAIIITAAAVRQES